MLLEKLKTSLGKMKEMRPLILNVTNYVTMDFMANGLLAIGAAPIMSEDPRELEELIAMSSAVNVNLGTLSECFEKKVEAVVLLAKEYNKPIILDPVGAGATKVRTELGRRLGLESAIIRSNASEIIALSGKGEGTFGVEAMDSPESARAVLSGIKKRADGVVVISGETDIIDCKGEREYLPFGSKMMSLITGMGCCLTAVIAGFRGIMDDSFEASRMGVSFFGLCGEYVEKKVRGPGSFKTLFLDALYDPDWGKLEEIVSAHEKLRYSVTD